MEPETAASAFLEEVDAASRFGAGPLSGRNGFRPIASARFVGHDVEGRHLRLGIGRTTKHLTAIRLWPKEKNVLAEGEQRGGSGGVRKPFDPTTF